MSPIYEQVVRKPASHGPAEMCKERNARLYIASMLVEYKCSEFQTYIQQVGWWKCSMFTILKVNTSVTSLISMYKSDRNNETFSSLIWWLFCSLSIRKYDSLTCCYTIQPETSRREIWWGFSQCSRLNLMWTGPYFPFCALWVTSWYPMNYRVHH